MEPNTTPTPKKVRPNPWDPITEEEYQRVKTNYPNITFNDEDQSFTTRGGKKQWARKLKFFHSFTPEELAMGRAVKAKNLADGWARFLLYIEGGMRISEAGKKCGFTHATVRSKIQHDPVFKKQIEEAEMKAAEPVEDSLFAAAINGNVPAAIKWLEKRAPERWPGDKVQIEQKNIYELDASDRVQNIVALMARLQERAQLSAAPETIDVEAVEPD